MPNDEDKKPLRNLHVEMDAEFHKRLKVLVTIQGVTLKGYALEAIQEKVARDEAGMRK